MIIEENTLIRVADDKGNEYILYPATKAENIIGSIPYTDDITGKKYHLAISNGKVMLKEIIE